MECGSSPTSKVPLPYDVEIHDMELNGLLEPVPMEEGNGGPSCLPPLSQETAMEEEEAGVEAAQQQQPPSRLAASAEDSG